MTTKTKTEQWLKKNRVEYRRTYEGIEVLGDLIFQENESIRLDDVISVGGYVYAYKGAKVDLRSCTSVGGYVDAYKGAKVDLRSCTSVGGNVYADEVAKVDLRSCKSVGEIDYAAIFCGKTVSVFDGIGSVMLSRKTLPAYRDWETDRKSTRLNSSHSAKSRMPSSA